MCGIAGLTETTDTEEIQAMVGALTHRGPDSTDYIQVRGVSLGCARLAIVDLEGGRQPLSDPTGRYHLVFNGEIFNARELRHKMRQAGVTFLSDHSDTEVLLQLLIRGGASAIHELNGMFSFVLLDSLRGTLFGACDRFGIKPLYLHAALSRIAFASELPPLLKLAHVSREVDAQALYHYLSFQSIPAPLTIFSGIRKLPAAHSFTYDLTQNRLVEKQYWEPTPGGTRSAVVPELEEQLEAAVYRWSEGDYPPTISLSGGIDSSLITALLGRSHSRVKTYTLGLSDLSQDDERENARICARHFGTEHTEIEVTPKDVIEQLPQMVRHLGEPYGGGLPAWFIFSEVARSERICLTGTGGDELFGNYRKWVPYENWKAKLRRKRPKWRPPGYDIWPFGSLYSPLVFRSGEKRSLGLYESEGEESEERIENLWPRHLSPRDAVTKVDLQLQLPNEFLFMTDRFSMAHSVEARTPFLDSNLVDFVLGLPGEERSGTKLSKGLLASLATSLLPEELVTAPKRGFTFPVDEWMKTHLRDLAVEMLAPSALNKHDLISKSAWENVIDPYLNGEGGQSQQVWTLFMLQMWAETFLSN